MANASPSRSGFGPWKVPRLGDSHRVERPATRIVTGTVGGWTDTPDSAPRLRQRPENSGALIRMELELRWNPTLQNALIRVHWCAAVRCCVAAGAPSSSAVVEVPKFKSRQPPLSAGFVLHPSHLPLSPFRSPFRIANLARCSRAELPSRLFRSPVPGRCPRPFIPVACLIKGGVLGSTPTSDRTATLPACRLDQFTLVEPAFMNLGICY